MPQTVISVSVPTERIRDLLFGHIQSGDWLHEVSGTFSDLTKNGIKVTYDREEDNEGDCGGNAVIHRHHVLAGLSTMARENPYQFGEWLRENDDAITCDVAWQFIILGKEIYG